MADNNNITNGMSVNNTKENIKYILDNPGTTGTTGTRIGDLEKKVEAISGGGSAVEIVDNLTSTDTDKALSANQGKVLKDSMVGKKDSGGGEVFNCYNDGSSSIPGPTNIASGNYSHAEGVNTQASGISGSHAEGANTKAYGYASHAEGDSSKAIGKYSHAEGTFTIAGCKGFKITATDSSAKTYTLDSVEGLAVNDVFGICVLTTTVANIYSNIGKIKSIDKTNKIVTVDTYKDVSISSSTTSYLYISEKPDTGTTAIEISCPHAEGYKTQALGDGSHAEGNSTVASGVYSHAEGGSTEASGLCSHAGGRESKSFSDYTFAHGNQVRAGLKCFSITSYDKSNKTYTLGSVIGLAVNDVFTLISKDGYNKDYGKITAIDTTNKKITVNNYLELSGSYKYIAILEKPTIGNTIIGESAHAEGDNTKALGGTGSHAEGSNTVAIGESAHAEGSTTTAGGMGSHAEGEGTIASGYYSHVEGFDTTAASFCQHVQGKNNIPDTTGRYAHIVGNGELFDTSSNAHTLDWSGNAWFAGDIKIGGTSYDDAAAKTIATTDYVNSRNSGDVFVYFHMIDTEFVKCTDWTKVGSLAKYCDSSSTILISATSNYPVSTYALNDEVTLNTRNTAHDVKLKILDNYDIMIKCTSTFSATGKIDAYCQISIRNGSYIDIEATVS